MQSHEQAKRSCHSSGRVVVLNGFPGSGKYTILRHIQTRCHNQETRLVDNHLLIDPVQALYPDRGPAHHRLRRQVRSLFLSSIRELVKEGYLVLMTACLGDNDADRQVLEEHIDIVRDTGIPLLWVNIHCGYDELEKRAMSAERVQGTKTKLTDPEALRQLVNTNKLAMPANQGADLPGVNMVAENIDVSGTIEESVTNILKIMDRHKLNGTGEEQAFQ
ncbi:hypothetical protein F5B20DRAFT_497908 [Whalleya microplaca]|nr:hypothetical protein F5B20DRAFT_497908 [Whalleya microplaca]